MLAIILAGGKGTRLRPFTITIPKPLLPLGDVPILEVVMRQLSDAGFTRLVITLGHMAHLFAPFADIALRRGIKVESIVEEQPLGTAGSLRLVRDLEDHFLVMNGDLLTTLNYRDLFSFHRRRSAWGTIAVSRREVHIDYGVIRSDDGSLTEYVEKPTIRYSVSMGINVLSRECLEFIPETGKLDMPELMMAMHQAGRPVACYETDCYWQDIGRFDDYQKASEDFVQNPARFFPKAAGAGE